MTLNNILRNMALATYLSLAAAPLLSKGQETENHKQLAGKIKYMTLSMVPDSNQYIYSDAYMNQGMVYVHLLLPDTKNTRNKKPIVHRIQSYDNTFGDGSLLLKIIEIDLEKSEKDFSRQKVLAAYLDTNVDGLCEEAMWYENGIMQTYSKESYDSISNNKANAKYYNELNWVLNFYKEHYTK